jgi:hypothetical protein
MGAADDWDFTTVAELLNISITDGASEFFLGQYASIENSDLSIMVRMAFDEFPDCEEETAFLGRPPENYCRRFRSQWNRIVFLHRINLIDWPETIPAVYECPDDLHWWMGSSWPYFCMMRPLNSTKMTGSDVLGRASIK